MNTLRQLDLGDTPYGARLVPVRDRLAEMLALGQVSRTYEAHVASYVRQFAEAYQGGLIADEFVTWLAARAQTLKPSTLRFVANSLGSLLVDSGYLPEGTLRRLRRRLPQVKGRRVPMSDEQHIRLMRWAARSSHSETKQALFLVMGITGLRISEVRGLRCCDVRHVRREYGGAERDALRIEYSVAKQRRARRAVTWVPLTHATLPLVVPLLHGPLSAAPLFSICGGRALSARTIQKWLEEARRTSNELGMHPHAMRHRVARGIQRLAAGKVADPEETARLVLGHRPAGIISAYMEPPDIWPFLAAMVYDENQQGETKAYDTDRNDQEPRPAFGLQHQSAALPAAPRLSEGRTAAGHGSM